MIQLDEVHNGGSKLGRNFYQDRTVFSDPAQANEIGQMILDDILNDPESEFYYDHHHCFGCIFEVMHREKGGVRYKLGGDMIGFLQPREERTSLKSYGIASLATACQGSLTCCVRS